MTRLDQQTTVRTPGVERPVEVENPLAKATSSFEINDRLLREAKGPTLVALGGPTIEQLTSSYHASVKEMNEQGQRIGNHPAIAWLGNLLAGSGIRPEVKVCAEQASFVGERMKDQFKGNVKVELLFLGQYDHTVLKITPNGGPTLYSDPWGGQPPTTNFNKIYMHEKGVAGSVEIR